MEDPTQLSVKHGGRVDPRSLIILLQEELLPSTYFVFSIINC